MDARPEEVYRVIVVDDDQDVAELMQIVLERRGGCEVLVLNSPRLVVEAAERFQPDLLLTDIEMPGMSGIELITAVRFEHPGLPVIVMTAHASVDYAVKAIRHEADEFLVKPVSTNELIISVRRLSKDYREMQFDTQDRVRAAEVQRGLQPRPITGLDGYQLAGACIPARVVGGDFFDWYRLGDDLVITLADVMGKGVGAAIIAATVRSVIRGTTDGTDLAAAISKADSELESDLSGATTFVTLFHSTLNPRTGLLTYVDAGHGLTTVCRKDGSVRRLATTSLPLGLGLNETWREHHLILEPGDTFISVSDGILDLFDGTLASFTDIERIARDAPDARSVVEALRSIAGVTAPDDVTVVVLRRDA
ncbi:MAG: SpoIIE family protein phosphatase [Actinomycetota bacterium]